MDFYFWGRYINIDADDKKVERNMYAAILYFQGSIMIILGMRSEKNDLEEFFS